MASGRLVHGGVRRVVTDAIPARPRRSREGLDPVVKGRLPGAGVVATRLALQVARPALLADGRVAARPATLASARAPAKAVVVVLVLGVPPVDGPVATSAPGAVLARPEAFAVPDADGVRPPPVPFQGGAVPRPAREVVVALRPDTGATAARPPTPRAGLVGATVAPVEGRVRVVAPTTSTDVGVGAAGPIATPNTGAVTGRGRPD